MGLHNTIHNSQFKTRNNFFVIIQILCQYSWSQSLKNIGMPARGAYHFLLQKKGGKKMGEKLFRGLKINDKIIIQHLRVWGSISIGSGSKMLGWMMAKILKITVHTLLEVPLNCQWSVLSFW